jgi:hypothetical protein
VLEGSVPDWAIVLVAAFGGGLAGAVLQPVTSHILEGVRSQQYLRRTREGQLRRMVMAAIARGRTVAGAAIEASFFAEQGYPLSQLDRAKRAAILGEDVPLWQPHRISDPRLQQLAREYNKAVNDLWLLLLDRSFDRRVEESRELTSRLEELQHHITLRMDELNWPEVEN